MDRGQILGDDGIRLHPSQRRRWPLKQLNSLSAQACMFFAPLPVLWLLCAIPMGRRDGLASM